MDLVLHFDRLCAVLLDPFFSKQNKYLFNQNENDFRIEKKTLVLSLSNEWSKSTKTWKTNHLTTTVDDDDDDDDDDNISTQSWHLI